MFRLLPFVLFPTAALAHPGDHAQTGLWHSLTQPDHLGMLVVAVAVAAVAWARWRA